MYRVRVALENVIQRNNNMFVRKANINCVITTMRREVHSCPVYYNEMNKQAKTLAKLMTGSHRKKKNWSNLDFTAKAPILPSSKSFQQGTHTKRRVDVLNKLFMRSITDLLATGEVAPELIGRGLSITKVKVASDFHAVNVYWIAKGTPHNAELDKILENAGFELRHELTQLHIMGKLPRINFVADKGQSIIEATLQSLEKVKLKDGYVSEDIAESLKSDCILELPIDSETQDKIRSLEENYHDNPLPLMTHDVLGLDHAVIWNRIQASVEKSEAKHRRETMDDEYVTYSQSETNKFDTQNHGIVPSDISQYIAKQRILKKKAQRALKREFQQGMECIEISAPEREEYVDVEDGDFIEDFYVIREGIEMKKK